MAKKKQKKGAAKSAKSSRKKVIRKAASPRRRSKVGGVGAARTAKNKRPRKILMHRRKYGRDWHVKVGGVGADGGLGGLMKPDVLGIFAGAVAGSALMGMADGYQAKRLVEKEVKPEDFMGGPHFSPAVAAAAGAALMFAGPKMKQPLLTQAGLGLLAAGVTSFGSRAVGMKAAEMMMDDKTKVASLQRMKDDRNLVIDKAIADAVKAASGSNVQLAYGVRGVGSDVNFTVGADVDTTVGADVDTTVGADVDTTVGDMDDAPSANPFIDGVGETIFAPSRIGQKEQPVKLITTDTPEMNRLIDLIEQPDGVRGVGFYNGPYLYGPGPVPYDPYATGTQLYGVGTVDTDQGMFIAGEMPPHSFIRGEVPPGSLIR